MENHPPRLTTVDPPPTILPARLSVDCPFWPFYAGAADPDAEDSIYWRVFINYATNTPQQKVAAEVRELPGNPLQPGADRSFNFPVETNDIRFSASGDPITTMHAVEVLIADRPFDDLREPRARVPEEGGLTDSFVWPVRLTTDPPDSGSCPGGGG